MDFKRTPADVNNLLVKLSPERSSARSNWNDGHANGITRCSTAGLLSCVLASAVSAHGVAPWGRSLGWYNSQIDDVIDFKNRGRKLAVQGKECVAGQFLNFNVSDEFAFDIDEPVWIDLTFQLQPNPTKVEISYNGAYSTGMFDPADKSIAVNIPVSAEGKSHVETVPLDRARFANQGFGGTDFSIQSASEYVLCDIAVRRSYKTPIARTTGELHIEVEDEHGLITPARMGIYDSSGRLASPSDDAVQIRGLSGYSRIVNGFNIAPWPVKQGPIMYTAGQYHTRLPAGEYDIYLARGYEYRLSHERVSVKSGERKDLNIRMKRWADMAANGWYSGEDHIHYIRNSRHDDHNLMLLTKAEDLRVGNILEFDNIVGTHWSHYDWAPVASNEPTPFVLSPGQEAPRTSLLGHTAMLNIHERIRDDTSYLLYHNVFEKARAQGGLAGYAHVVGNQVDRLYQAKGMPIDVAFGLVDFAEIMTNATGEPSIWFDYLNLGYRIAPTAGTDFPWGSVPGASRNYVRVEGPFSSESWFRALKEGRTFVTNGPLIELNVNGHPIGTDVHLSSGTSILIEGRASLNPDLGTLSSIEIIEQGEVRKALRLRDDASSIEIKYKTSAKHGTWFVLRARGATSGVSAISAPVYISVDGEGSWKPSAVPAIVAKLQRQMQDLLSPAPRETEATEAYLTQPDFDKAFLAQYPALKERIKRASEVYEELAQRAKGRSVSDQTKISP